MTARSPKASMRSQLSRMFVMPKLLKSPVKMQLASDTKHFHSEWHHLEKQNNQSLAKWKSAKIKDVLKKNGVTTTLARPILPSIGKKSCSNQKINLYNPVSHKIFSVQAWTDFFSLRKSKIFAIYEMKTENISNVDLYRS